MGNRMKSNPQSTIHLRSSSVVPRRSGEGLGELKSVRLNPRQRGSGLVCVDSAPLPIDPGPAISARAADASVVLIKVRRFIGFPPFQSSGLYYGRALTAKSSMAEGRSLLDKDLT